MKRLFHWSLDPHGRTARLVLGEKAQAVEYVDSPPWSPHAEISRAAPGARGPMLTDTDTLAGRMNAIGTRAIVEHLEETIDGARLLPINADDRAEARRVWQWCEEAMAEVNASLLAERINQAVRRGRAPDSSALRTGAHALRSRLIVLNVLAETRPWMAGRSLTIADLSAAAHLSAYDYFGDVDWPSVPDLKTWYAKMKSRPAMRAVLSDRVEGARPAAHYADLDF